MNVEVCIESAGERTVRRAARAARAGGAATIELCRAMSEEGLTPPPRHIRAARRVFQEQRGVMVMIRPRSGHFVYSAEEVDRMVEQISVASEAGADGVVVGALTSERRIDGPAVQSLLEAARAQALTMTFHRAFDAVDDPHRALDRLIEWEVDRVLTSGTPWGSGKGATAGAELLETLIRQAGRRIEIVLGGGIHAENVGALRSRLPVQEGNVSVHAFSGARKGGVTDEETVRALVQATATGS